MARALLCCLILLLPACASARTPVPAATGVPAIPAATAPVPSLATAAAAPATTLPSNNSGAARPCPEGLPVRGVGSADGSLHALLPGDADYNRVPWLRCFATLEAAEEAGFARATGNRATPGPSPAGAGPAVDDSALVTRVIDGHTIEVRLPNGQVETVRYLGIDAPELGDCYGEAARARNLALVAGRTVRLERDTGDRDRNERLLRYVWVVGDDGVSRMVNEELARDGFAAAAIRSPDLRHGQRLLAAEREAREAARGVWGTCAGFAAPPASPSVGPQTPTPSPVMPATATSPPAPPTAVPTRPAPPTPAPTPPPAPTATAAPVVSAAPRPAPTATRVPPAPTRTPTPPPAQACHPSYPTVCIPPPPPDLDCADIPHRNFPVRPPDPHRFDGDKDGIGCEQ